MYGRAMLKFAWDVGWLGDSMKGTPVVFFHGDGCVVGDDFGAVPGRCGTVGTWRSSRMPPEGAWAKRLSEMAQGCSEANEEGGEGCRAAGEAMCGGDASL